MAGSTANMALVGSSMGLDPFNIIGFKYLTDKLKSFGNVFGPTESINLVLILIIPCAIHLNSHHWTNC